MPDAWTKKDERQFKHIRKSERARGRSEVKADEIAARTVNKIRRQQGRTSNTTSQGTGNPNLPLEERTKQELMNRARSLDITGRSRMRKAELIQAIRSKRR